MLHGYYRTIFIVLHVSTIRQVTVVSALPVNTSEWYSNITECSSNNQFQLVVVACNQCNDTLKLFTASQTQTSLSYTEYEELLHQLFGI